MSSSSYYSGSSNHSCSAKHCQIQIGLTSNNFGRRFSGCCYYDVVSNSWFSSLLVFWYVGFLVFGFYGFFVF